MYKDESKVFNEPKALIEPKAIIEPKETVIQLSTDTFDTIKEI